MSGDPVEFRNAAELAALPEDTQEIRGVKVEDADLAGLERVTGLRGLYLEGCFELSDAALEHIGRHAPLEILYISGNAITDDGLRHLAGLAHLSELGLDAPVTGEGFRHLAPLTRLASLHLPACTRLEPAGIRNLDRLPALATIGFYSCPRMADEWIAALAEVRSLRTIQLLRCEAVSDAALATLGESRPDLNVEKF